MAASYLGHRANYRIACDGILGGSRVQEASFFYFMRGHELTPLLRHYFIKHLVGVVKRNAKHKREAEARNAGIPPIDIDNRSTEPTGVVHRTKSPPSIHAIRRVDEAPQPIQSTDWNSRKPSLFNTVFVQMSSHVP